MEKSTTLFCLTNSEFKQLSGLVYEHCGINLSIGKKVMLEARLNKRLRALNVSTFKEYIQFITSQDGLRNEFTKMIDVVTTNKTDFFREPHHFDFLQKNVLPKWMDEGQREVTIWSAACSTGEEPYTLAMVLQDFVEAKRDFTYSIFASDISTHVLEKASLAVYPLDRVADIPLASKRKYLLKSKNKVNPTVRIVPELRSRVRFGNINFMDNSWSINESYDVIFCRNVLIYFDRKTQLEVMRKIVSRLRPGGYLFIGHSESLYQLDLPLEQVKPTIYQKI